MTTPSPTENTTIIPSREAREYLAKRDIDANCLAVALTEGLAQRQNCEVYHPVTAPGYYQWSETNLLHPKVPLRKQQLENGEPGQPPAPCPR